MYEEKTNGVEGHHEEPRASVLTFDLDGCLAVPSGRAPKLRYSHSWLAATYAQMGQMEKARAEAAEVLRLQPNYTITGTTRRIVTFKQPKDDKHFFDGLRKAGLAE